MAFAPLLLLLAAGLTPARAADDAGTASSALLPRDRIVTYYGNPYSKRMGILGEIPPEEMMDRLEKEAALWQKADSSTTVRPGLELVATVASDFSGDGGFYRTPMPPALIDKVIGWARKRRWLTILDIQVGRSTVRREIERIEPFLERPDVHLAIDPEFQMPKGLKPGQRIGTSDAEDVNVAIIELAKIIEKKHLPPKLLLVHRFTDDMLRRYDKIRLDPRVQVVVVMDGYGSPYAKSAIYRREIKRQPVEFAGIKLFYKNDKPMMTRQEVLGLEPVPRVIIYQ